MGGVRGAAGEDEMSTPRFFVEASELSGSEITLTGDAHHYATKVVRVARGESVRLFDDQGREFEGVVGDIDARRIVIRVTGERAPLPEPPVRLTVCAGGLKADKMAWVVQKCAELGVARLVPLITARTVARDPKSERWRKISLEASRQCGRASVMAVEEPRLLADSLALVAEGELALALHEREQHRGLRAILREQPQAATVTIWVGPEGGFSAEEATAMEAAGALPVSLGPRFLRAETAAIAAAAIVLYDLGDLGVPG
jgi:16S rRNA (uracil1498-N3)-methyltransferase